MRTRLASSLVVPSRRRRSQSSDPLRKVTLQLSESVVEAIKVVVEVGDAASANVFVEDAIRAKLRDRRRTKVYAAYEEAARDPQYLADTNSDLAAFDASLGDGFSSGR